MTSVEKSPVDAHIGSSYPQSTSTVHARTSHILWHSPQACSKYRELQEIDPCFKVPQHKVRFNKISVLLMSQDGPGVISISPQQKSYRKHQTGARISIDVEN